MNVNAIAAGEDGSRRILCVFPRYTSSFGMFEYAYPLTDGVQALMPPQGLLVVAAALPSGWQVRFVDENLRPADDAEFDWADAVFVSGMHAQRRQIADICRRAHRARKTAVLGGPSVSACPEYYPEFDYLHVGELGDATDELFARLGCDARRPDRQIVLTTRKRRDFIEFPVPAYELAELKRYYMGTIQYSSGCPYQCEFCDIPALYGRNPRVKTPEHVLTELDKLLACGLLGGLYFVDDNFIANRRAVREVLPHLIEWQRRHQYPFWLCCEATLNIAKRPEILALMREAFFDTIFCGVETPEPEALRAMAKGHNMMMPMLDAIATINRHGIEVAAGIIMGLDTDTPATPHRIAEFIASSHIPVLTINLLQALPQTPLWNRLQREGRLIDDPDRESNIDFLLPYQQVLAMWRELMARIYTPHVLFARFRHQLTATYPHRLNPGLSRDRLSFANLRRAFVMLWRVLWWVGVRDDFRREFWKTIWRPLLRGDIERVIRIGLLAHHMILSAREAAGGLQSASHYAAKPVDLPATAA